MGLIFHFQPPTFARHHQNISYRSEWNSRAIFVRIPNLYVLVLIISKCYNNQMFKRILSKLFIFHYFEACFTIRNLSDWSKDCHVHVATFSMRKHFSCRISILCRYELTQWPMTWPKREMREMNDIYAIWKNKSVAVFLTFPLKYRQS